MMPDTINHPKAASTQLFQLLIRLWAMCRHSLLQKELLLIPAISHFKIKIKIFDTSYVKKIAITITRSKKA